MRKSLILAAAMICGASGAYAQAGCAPTELTNYADSEGYILVKKLTCAQLACTYQEDANFLGVWYSGWYNGLAKKSALNVPRVKEGIHQVIVFCKENPQMTIIEAIDVILKREKEMSTR